ncbi:MAG: transporter substrate-binding domain-containing protein [Symbiobacteriaceae bacterium]|nr:transporter substrate-binding domain-containing protein [Symbiobacteriaceae bacterium]
MRRGIAAFPIAVLLVLSCLLSACNNSPDQIKPIQDRGQLRVGVKMDVPSFGYLNPETGEMEGIEVDLSREIAKAILGNANAIKFVSITAQTRSALLNNGEIDIVIATFTITEERKQSFNFSRAYFTDTIGYLVLNDARITSGADLDNRAVGVAVASTAKDAFLKESVSLGITTSMREYSSYPEIKAALVSGDIDAFIADKSILSGYLDDSCSLLDEGFNPQQYGIASKKENDKLAQRIDSILEEMEKDGRLAAILKQWGH